MYHAFEFLRMLLQGVEIAPVVFLGVEAGTAVVAALDDVPRDAGKGKARAAGHGATRDIIPEQ